jgi:hypothetical protein
MARHDYTYPSNFAAAWNRTAQAVPGLSKRKD